MPGQKTIENEDKAAMGSYRPESNFGTSDTVVYVARQGGKQKRLKCNIFKTLFVRRSGTS